MKNVNVIKILGWIFIIAGMNYFFNQSIRIGNIIGDIIIISTFLIGGIYALNYPKVNNLFKSNSHSIIKYKRK